MFVEERTEQLIFFHDKIECFKLLLAHDPAELERVYNEITPGPGPQPFGIPAGSSVNQKIVTLVQFCSQPSTSFRHADEKMIVAMGGLSLAAANIDCDRAPEVMKRVGAHVIYVASFLPVDATAPAPPRFEPLPDEIFKLPQSFKTSSIDSDSTWKLVGNDLFGIADKLYGKSEQLGVNGETEAWYKLIGFAINKGKMSYKIGFVDSPY